MCNVLGLRGGKDVWVAKLRDTLTVEWQRCLGGTADDYAGDIEPTLDGGYIVVGSTFSNNGDVSGNKGSADAWAVKLNATGQLQWQKCYGGTGDESFADVVVTPDNSYVVVGTTASTNGDIPLNRGLYDLWLIKLDQVSVSNH